jgi:hypothetical protein
MRKILNITLITIFTIFMMACEEDDTGFSGPARLIIAGPGSAIPGEVAEFTVGDVNNPESFNWTIDGPAQVVGDGTGNTVEVRFTGVGDVTLNVSSGEDQGLTQVEVEEVEPSVEARLNRTGALRQDESDTVFFQFATPLEQIPDLAMITDEGFVSGTLGDLQRIDDDSFFSIFTAGAGDGTPRALLQDITATEMFGGATIDSAIVNLFRVDNTPPVADISYSQTMVNEGTEITVTANFNERVMPQGSDTVILITFSRLGVTETDTLEATNDPLVYTVDYTVTADEANSDIEVGLPNTVDLARNPLADINNANEIRVDNVSPTLAETTAIQLTSGAVRISMTSSEDATGRFIVLEDGADAPVSAEDFEGGVANGTLSLQSSTRKSTSISLEAGNYDVYFMASDEAGNSSPIQMVNLTVN